MSVLEQWSEILRSAQDDSIVAFRQNRQLAASSFYDRLNARQRDEIRVASRLFDGSLLTSSFSYEHTFSSFRSLLFDRGQSRFNRARFRARLVRRSESVP